MKNKELEKALEAITYITSKFPEEPFRIICKYPEEAAPILLSSIYKAVEEQDELDENYQMHFYALFLLGQFRYQQAFPKLMEMLTLPSEVLEYLIGDAVTEGLKDILYCTYNGDLQMLMQYIREADCDDYAKVSALEMLTQLCLDGVVEESFFSDFLKSLIYDPKVNGSYNFDTFIAEAVFHCHLYHMIPDIKFLFKEDRVDIQIFGGYDDFVDHMFQYTEEEERVCDPIDSAADCLRHWVLFDKEDSKNSSLSKKELEKLMRDAYPTANQTIKKVKIGRNDSCPCGSGKKYKLCCMNAPKTEQDMIESREERESCLKYYPKTGIPKVEGRIYLEDYFDQESIELDKILYLALKHRMGYIWERDLKKEEERQRKYLWTAFQMFAERCERDRIGSFQEYDEKHMIHYESGMWMERLYNLLKEQGLKGESKQVKKYLNAFNKGL